MCCIGQWLYRAIYRKGIGLKFPNQDVGSMRQRKRTRRRLSGPRREFSFLFNNCGTLESVQPEIGSYSWKSTLLVGCPVRLLGPLKIRGRSMLALLIVLKSASGLQGSQPLVSRIRQVREVGILGS